MGMDTGIRVQPLFDLPASVSPRGCGAASPDGTEKRVIRDSGQSHSARGENHRPAERRASVRETSDGSVLEDPESRPGDIGREGPPGLQIPGQPERTEHPAQVCRIVFRIRRTSLFEFEPFPVVSAQGKSFFAISAKLSPWLGSIFRFGCGSRGTTFP